MVIFESHEVEGLLLPRAAQVESLTDKRARFTLEPIARGLGQTVGTALRRMLLSSLQGCAPTQVTLAQVTHEQATMAGIGEDVMDLLLNLRGVVFRLQGRQEAHLAWRVEHAGPFRAGDIPTPLGVEVLNPAHVLAHLSPGGCLDLRIRLQTGRGCSAAQQGSEHAVGGTTLSLDACYSPVRRVAMLVAHTRVLDRSDIDRVVLDIETNGSITPGEALRQGARLLMTQLQPFAERGSAAPLEAAPEDLPAWPVDGDAAELMPSIDELGLSLRTSVALKAVGLERLGDLIQRTETQLLKSPHLGRRGVNDIKDALAARGLMLGTALPGCPPVGSNRLH